MIKVENLHKYFGSLEVLKGVTTEIQQGEVVCVIGPSGSGKSTFLRCLNLLETPTKGEIYIEGTPLMGNLKQLDKLRERVGMVFQQFNLFPHMTVKRNVTLSPTKVLKKPQQQADARAIALLERCLLYTSRCV